METINRISKVILAVIISFVMILSVFLTNILPVQAAGTYNAQAAVNYAAANWNNGVGLCAEFVSNCLNAGGCNAYSVWVKDLKNNLQNGGWGTLYQMTTRYGQIYSYDNSGKIAVGDPIFYYCNICCSWMHTAIVGNIRSDGVATAYGHNSAWNNQEYLGGFIDANGHSGSSIVTYAFHMNSTSTHTCNFDGGFQYYWKAHPHYNCYACSICGAINENRNEPNYIDSCEECNIPADTIYSGSCGSSLTWNLNATTGLLKIEGNGDMNDYYSDYDTSNPAPWRAYANDIKTLEIANGVTSIGEYAFYKCTNLNSVTISNSVTKIYDSAFYNCSELTEITIPDSVTYLSNSVFSGCTSLVSVVLPNNITFIGSTSFSNCNSLTSINIPNGVTEIGRYAFSNCTSLTSIDIPNSVTTIYGYVFNNCTGLTSITLPNSIKIIEDGTFEGCTGLTNITLPSSVTRIGFSAFESCTGLTSIIIPNSVTYIDFNAFEGCSGLTSITIPNSVSHIGSDVFSDCCSLETIKVEEGNSFYYSSGNCLIGTERGALYAGCKNSIIPDGVTSIIRGAFRGCTGLTSIVLPNSVTSIGSSAFRGCTELTSITIPNSVTSIDSDSFTDCDNLTLMVCYESYAHTYAVDNEIPFILYCDHANTEIENKLLSTCTTDGYTGDIYCKDCGEIISEGEVIPAAHSYTEILYEAPTCSTTGLRLSECTECGDIKEEELPTTGHTYISVTTDATCITDGKIVYTCSNCQHMYIETIKAIGHVLSEILCENVTCTTDGLILKQCDNCGGVFEEITTATGHSYTSVKTDATCTSDGSIVYTCEKCGDTYTEVIKSSGHKFEITREKNPTCTSIGYIIYKCSVCEHSQIDKLDIIPHNYIVTETLATYTHSGEKNLKCDCCGDEKTEIMYAFCDFDKNGLVNESDYIVLESYTPTESEKTLLDFDSDGSITGFDKMIIKRLTSGGELQTVIDLNGDGENNVLDLVRLKKLAAGQSSENTSDFGGDFDSTGAPDSGDMSFVRKFILFIAYR